MLGDILKEAHALITGPRQEAYGTPAENFRRWADLCNAYFGEDWFTPEGMAMIAVLLKLSRIRNRPAKDSFTDAAGYLAIAQHLIFDSGNPLGDPGYYGKGGGVGPKVGTPSATVTFDPAASLGRPQPVE